MAKKRKVKEVNVSTTQPSINWKIPGKMTLTYDEEASAVYVKLREPKKGELLTTEEAAPGVLVDLDQAGSAVGVEILLS